MDLQKPMDLQKLSPRVQRACVWTGPALILIFLVGFVPLAGFGPPPSPEDSAEEIAQMYRDDTTAIRVGCLLMMFSLALLAPWGAAVAACTKRMERGTPVLTYASIACIGASVVIVELIPMTWAAAAFRPDDTSADITRALNDYGWFLFLFTWPPFSIWCVLIAAAVFGDHNAKPLFPRWIGYFNVWCALLLVPAGLMAFFKDGPFAFNGAITFYIPLGVFFIWMIGMTWAVLDALKREGRPTTAAREPVGALS